MNFQLDYLKKVKETVSQAKTGDEFIRVMKAACPGIAGEENLTAMAAKLYN